MSVLNFFKIILMGKNRSRVRHGRVRDEVWRGVGRKVVGLGAERCRIRRSGERYGSGGMRCGGVPGEEWWG